MRRWSSPVLCLILAAGCGPGVWVPVADGLDEALLSVTGSAADDVWTVGGDVGSGPAFLHWDGTTWSQVEVGSSGDLWWVWQAAPDDVWAVGAEGRILRHTPSKEAVVVATVDEDLTLYGIWGASTDEVWAVGGNPTEASDAAALWRSDGGAWLEVELPAELAAAAALYKVWGSAADDVWVVGTGGVIGHYDGDAWLPVASPTTRDLFTVHGLGKDEAFAVGGFGTATLLHWNGRTWSDESQPGVPAFPGVFARDGKAWAAGSQGAVWSRDASGWTEDPRGLASRADLHAVWVDPDGGVWTVGGNIASYPLSGGVLTYGGGSPPELLAP
ncbi:MAG: hypothetical protein H6732_11060 [Alphaproteobacteria bacterium]|nr:hypothetical protein [Alphaproteobacteria bacterium]